VTFALLRITYKRDDLMANLKRFPFDGNPTLFKMTHHSHNISDPKGEMLTVVLNNLIRWLLPVFYAGRFAGWRLLVVDDVVRPIVPDNGLPTQGTTVEGQ
jgi:hypothetical protein